MRQDAHSSQTSLTRTACELAAISSLALFQELALIRWLPGQVRTLAYFPNLILISAFLGLGVGCLRAGRRSLLWLWPVSLVTLVTVSCLMGGIAFTHRSASEFLWLLYYDLPKDALVVHSVYPPIIISFVLGAVTFVALGQLLAERLDIFRECSSALWGYSWDIAGSLIGVIGFVLVGALGCFPWLWFTVLLVIATPFFLLRFRWRRAVWLVLMPLIPMTVHLAERAQYYSPYYAISVEQAPGAPSFAVLTNGSLHQRAHPLTNADQLAVEWQRELRSGYQFPYRQLLRPPRDVLVLGAGTGNDIAVLLDMGAQHIDAVEIDPVILKLGRKHPNRPYASPRVRVINTDARSHLNQTETVYDLIVFGTLDSQTRLSALSNVRLDNFVYTEECIKAARSRLSEDGGMVLFFMVSTEYIERRLHDLVASAFAEPPLVRTDFTYLFNRVFMAGPAFAHLRIGNPALSRHWSGAQQHTVELPTDDWPYLYLRQRGISSFYLILILIFTVLSAAAVVAACPDLRARLWRSGEVDLEMFLFGLAFLLIETKFVTSMNLVWGATWLTSAVVFGSVLTMVLLATVMMELRPVRWRTATTGLIVCLLLTYLIPTRWLLLESGVTRLLVSMLFVGAPILFASACFAIQFRQRRQAHVAFGWNLLGAVCGGFLELLSMMIGLGNLSLLAMAAYVGAFWIRERRKQDEVGSS
jgi:spermidine synthase